MTAEEQIALLFKRGFYLRCADEGLDAEQAEALAEEYFAKTAASLEGVARLAAKITAGLGIAGLGVAGLAGYAGGHVVGGTQADPLTPKRVETDGLKQMYAKETKRLNQIAAAERAIA